MEIAGQLVRFATVIVETPVLNSKNDLSTTWKSPLDQNVWLFHGFAYNEVMFIQRFKKRFNGGVVTACFNPFIRSMLIKFGFFIAVFVFVASGSLSVRGDEVQIKGGGFLRGEVIATPTEAKPFYDIVTDDGIAVRLPRANVIRVQKKSEERIKYEELLPALSDTVEDHLKMAEWCRQNRLVDEREFHHLAVLRLDPDHAETRRILKYAKRKDGRWLLIEQLRMEQGFVRDGSDWVTPEWKAIEEADSERRKAQSELRSDIKNYRKWLEKGDRGAEAVENIKQIRDPLAAELLADWMKEERNEWVQELLIDTLAQIDSNYARKTLITMAMASENTLIRESCLTTLKRLNSPAFANDFIRGLNPELNPENKYINRAAIALGWLDAEQAIQPLIEALVTEHRIANPAANGGSITANNSGAFSVGGKQPKLITRELRNPDVLQTLRELTGENYEYDKEAWTRWYARSNTPNSYDLRRNP